MVSISYVECHVSLYEICSKNCYFLIKYFKCLVIYLSASKLFQRATASLFFCAFLLPPLSLFFFLYLLSLDSPSLLPTGEEGLSSPVLLCFPTLLHSSTTYLPSPASSAFDDGFYPHTCMSRIVQLHVSCKCRHLNHSLFGRTTY